VKGGKMDNKELIKEEIALTEEGLKNKHLEKRAIEIKIYQTERQLEELEMFLEKDILTRQLKDNIDRINKDIERKKDSAGNELTDTDIDALNIRLSMFAKDINNDIPNSTLRIKISEVAKQVDFLKENLGVIEKQIREKKVISIHR
jgi:hypothetical protein